MGTLFQITSDLPAGTVSMLPADAVPVQKSSSGRAIYLTSNLLRGQSYTAGGSTLTLTSAAHGCSTINLDTAAGTTITLPAASGSGVWFKFIVTVLATSNNHIIKVANASDTMIGIIFTMDDTAANAEAYAAAATSDTITLNRTTTGSVTKGEWIFVEDVATNLWHVRGFITNTGSSATPFSATV